MTVVAAYDAEQFDSLPSLDDAQVSLEALSGALRGLAGIVSAHGADDEFGIALLHRHFELESSERLVESIDPDRRLSTSEPAKAEELDHRVLPHLFRAVPTLAGYAWYPLEFVSVDAAHSGVGAHHDWFGHNDKLLDEIASFLDREDAISSFGISLNHGRDEIECGDDEVLVEETHVGTRTLTMRPRPAREVGTTATPTNWSLLDGEVVMRCTCQRAGDERHGHFETN